MRKLFSNFEQLPVNLSCKLFDMLNRPILSYNCEIWYMDEYLPLYRAMLRATRNNTFCDTLALHEKSSYEKIHTKYCKTVLGLKKTACNISTLSELGRLPIASFIKTQVMMYFVRINTNNINPLIKESLNVNKSLHDEGFYTWYTLALNVFQEFDLDAEDFSNMDKCFHKIKVPFKKEFKKVVHNNYIQKTKDKLSKLTDNSQLYLYNKIKHDIVLEEYLIKENQRFSRACIVHLVIKKTNWSYVKTMSCSGSHLGITINIKNTKFVKDLPMTDAQFRFNQCNSFREEDISVFSRYGPVLIL